MMLLVLLLVAKERRFSKILISSDGQTRTCKAHKPRINSKNSMPRPLEADHHIHALQMLHWSFQLGKIAGFLNFQWHWRAIT